MAAEPPAAPEQLRFPAASLIAEAARLIVGRNKERLPDLSALSVVIPLRASPALKDAIAQEARALGFKAVLLPRMGSLADLAAKVPVDVKVHSESERTLTIFQGLKRQRWFSSAECLRVARELTRLVDGLSAGMRGLPESMEAHQRELARAYAVSTKNEDFNFEARLTYDTWRALSQGGGAVDAATRYGLQLAAWAAAASDSLYVIGESDWTERERRFFARHHERAEVTMLQAVWPTANDAEVRARFLARAFAQAPGAPQAAGAPPTPPDTNAEQVQGWLACCRTRDVEEEALAALHVMKEWLREGLTNIAVVALDRQTARRLRALAERDAIYMQDEVGWPYSTTVCATALMRWLEARQDGFYHITVLDLLKSPFLFTDLKAEWGRERLKAAVDAIERAARRYNIVAGLADLRIAVQRLNGGEVEDACTLLDRLITADRAFPPSRRSAGEWLADMRSSLITLGIEAGWRVDAAGAGLIDCLDQMASDVAGMALPLTASEWFDWLRMSLEDAHFRDDTIESPVVLTALAATRLRVFEGAIVVGASTQHLPGAPASDGLFNQSVRRALGLRTHADELASISRDLCGLLQTSGRVWFGWQSENPDEPSPPAPWLHALMLEARRAGGELLQGPEGESKRVAEDAPTERPAPVLVPEEVPVRISASGYQSLMDCPYQYFARAVLKLRETDDIAETLDKRDFGELVHKILNRFHRRIPLITGVDADTLRAAFVEESEAVFAEALQRNFEARAWLARWQDALDSYLDWQRGREAEGWRWQEGESAREVEIALEGGAALVLEGRIDRIDRRRNEQTGLEELAVIDYKARQANPLRHRLETPGEDVQLPVYAALIEGRPVTEAAYLAIESAGVKKVAHADVADAGHAARERLAGLFAAMYQGVAMPAQGAEKICTHCEARGLCRRDHWVDGNE